MYVLTIDHSGKRVLTTLAESQVEAEVLAIKWAKSFSSVFDPCTGYDEVIEKIGELATEEFTEVSFSIDEAEDPKKEDEPTCCPICGDENISARSTNHGTGYASRTVDCNACGTKWVEYFEFKYWEEL